MSVTIQIQLREDTAANWTSANPTLLSAEVGYENDTGKFKFGDGVTAWSALPYFSTVTNDQIAVGNGTGAFDGSSSLTWDGTTLGVTGAITCNAFTSNGIDDNATVETLQVADGQVAVGNNATEEAVILYVLSDDLYHTYLRFGSDTDATAGQLDYFYNAGSPIFTIGTTVASGEFRLESGNGVTALTLDASQNATFAGSIEADGNLTLNNSNTSVYLDDTSGSTAGTDRLQFNIDNDIFSIKSRTASTNALNEGVWVATNTAGSLTKQEWYIANSVELTLTAGNATFAGDVKADGYIQSNTATDTELNDIAHAINTNAGKIQGAMVYNTTQDKPVWAVGNTDGSVWVDGAGTTANTPVV